jgi:hypothetical protein
VINVRHRDLLTAIGVDAIDREALAGLPDYLRSLETTLSEAQQALDDDDRLAYAVGDASNIVQVLRTKITEGRTDEE